MALRTILLTIVLLVSACAGPAEGPAAAPIVLPTETCRGYFLIPVTLAPREGYPADRTLWFVYDTGARISVVDPQSIVRVSNVTVVPGQTVNLTSAAAGPFVFDELPARVQDLDHLSRALGRRIDGIMGFGTFGDYLLTLDYARDEIRLQKGALPRPDGRTVFDATGPDMRPWLKVEFPNRMRRLLVDSGAARSVFVVRDLDRYETVASPRVTGVTFGLSDVERRSSARSHGPVMIGQHELVAPILQSTSGPEVIGGKVMRHFLWTFDPQRRRVRLEPLVPATPIVFGPVLGSGLVVGAHDEGFRVTAVLAGTPAADADVRVGDVVTHFDGIPVADRGCVGAFDSRGVVTVTIRRDTTIFAVELEVVALVE